MGVAAEGAMDGPGSSTTGSVLRTFVLGGVLAAPRGGFDTFLLLDGREGP